MKLLLSLVALLTIATGEQAQAIPSDLVSQIITTSTGYGRAFRSTRTDVSLGCTFDTVACVYPEINIGNSPTGENCCRSKFAVNENDPEMAEYSDSLAAAMGDGGSREGFWGYIGTTSRSPNNGRTVSAPSRLDACLGYGEVDALGTGSSGWMNCYSKCDSTSNGYCNNTGSNNGSSGVTNAACKDRCDCVVTGFGTCENL